MPKLRAAPRCCCCCCCCCWCRDVAVLSGYNFLRAYSWRPTCQILLLYIECSDVTWSAFTIRLPYCGAVWRDVWRGILKILFLLFSEGNRISIFFSNHFHYRLFFSFLRTDSTASCLLPVLLKFFVFVFEFLVIIFSVMVQCGRLSWL